MHNKQIKREILRNEKLHKKFSQKHLKEREPFLEAKIAKYVPEKLSTTLHQAFEKAFAVIFDKGTVIIEKTVNVDNLNAQRQVKEFSAETLATRKATKTLLRSSETSKPINLAISAVEGIGLGLVGAGLPDIPLFTAILLRGIYEIAVKNGFSYDAEAEKIFILKMIAASMSYGNTFSDLDQQINNWILDKQSWAESLDEQIKQTANALSKEMLYLKFVQGIPVLGIVGGLSDVVFQKQILDYCQIQYQKRVLHKFQ